MLQMDGTACIAPPLRCEAFALNFDNWEFNLDPPTKSLERSALRGSASISVAIAADVRENHKSLRCPLSRTQQLTKSLMILCTQPHQTVAKLNSVCRNCTKYRIHECPNKQGRRKKKGSTYLQLLGAQVSECGAPPARWPMAEEVSACALTSFSHVETTHWIAPNPCDR